MVQMVSETEECTHHWVLASPQNDEVRAVCKRCHASRVYPARLEHFERFDDYRELAQCHQPVSRLQNPLSEELPS